MTQTERSDGAKSETLSERVAAWGELVERCERKPARKRVHALRVVTLRIQAEVVDELKGLPRASREAQAMVRFGKLADKLRDALGAVRELDVWIGKLKGLQESLGGANTYVPRSSRETTRQLERLERRLMKKRERAGAKLVKSIEKREHTLRMAGKDLLQATSERADSSDDNQARTLLEEFEQIVTEYPVLDQENLHNFRKRIKNIRYVAEIHAADLMCGRIAEEMKRAQGAIGEWHDWQVLARTAGHGKQAKNVDAVELLSSLSRESFQTAMATCDRVLRRMADLHRELDLGLDVVRKRPVRDESAVKAGVLKLA